MSPFPRTDGWNDPALTPQELLEQMDAVPDSLILTASARSARFLTQQYEALQRRLGRTAWPAPRLQPWDAWLASLWDLAVRRNLEDRLLLSDVQEVEIWRAAIADSSAAGRSLHSAESLAKLAARAWQAMQRYEISHSRLTLSGDVDTRAFREWAETVLARARRSGMLLDSLLEHAARTWIADSRLSLPSTFWLVGFDQLVPAQQTILQALRQRECTALTITLRARDAASVPPRLYVAPSSDAECAAAAAWAREVLERDPKRSVAILGSFDHAGRAQMERRLLESLAPEALSTCNRAPMPYEFSLGQPMHGLVPVRTALLLLQWATAPLSSEDISWLLVHGTFTGVPANTASRARLDMDVRERPYQSGGAVSLPGFLDWLPRARQNDATREALRALLQTTRSGMKQARRTMPDWRAAIDERLQAAQWQLLTPTGSRQFQLLRRWEALLDRLASLGTTLPPQPWADALERLRGLAAEMLFAEESQGAPVQILGAAEAAGMVFDAVWCMQASIADFPSASPVLPFLPWSVQRDAQMPHTGSVDAEFAVKTAQRIAGCANQVVMSFALGPEDDALSGGCQDVLLAPAVRAALPGVPLKALPAELFPTEPLTGTGLETVSEESGVARQALSVSGGVRFLELQAECPFRAFAETRLRSAPVDSLESDLGPRAQGQTLHRVLEAFWRDTKTQAQLAAQLAAGELPAHLRPLIDQAMAPFLAHAEQPWHREALALEAQRLHERLLEWLTLEAARPPFSVEQTEVRLEGREIAGVTFTSKVDRVDRVQSGIALIDYKTSVGSKKSCWEGDRPEAPQLPAYAALLSRPEENQLPIAGVALASFERDDLGFPVAVSLPGVFREEDASKKRSRTNLTAEEMANTISDWTAALERLAAGFLHGHAVLDPRKGTATCARCDQKLLCRLAEAGLDGASDDEGDGDEEA